MKAKAILLTLLAIAPTLAEATEAFDNVPTNIVELAATAKHRYLSAFVCSKNACGYERYIQEIQADEIICTRKIAELSNDSPSAYPVWKDRPETLYLTIVDITKSKSYAAKLVTGPDCSYSLHMEPLNSRNSAESEADFGG